MNNELLEQLRVNYTNYLMLKKDASVTETEQLTEKWMSAYNAAYNAFKFDSHMRDKLRQVAQECEVAARSKSV